MYPHHKHIVGRKLNASCSDHLSQIHNQNQVEVHNFKPSNNNNNRKSSSGLKSFNTSESSHFDTSHFLQSDSPNNSSDYYRSFNHHFPELVTGCSPTFDEHSESTPIHGSITPSSQQNHQNEYEGSPKSPKHDERKTPNIFQKRPGFPQVRKLNNFVMTQHFNPVLLLLSLQRIQTQMKPPNDDDEQPTKYNEDQDNIDEFYDFDRREFFSPFQQQELQQQKLLEFQQQSKLQQVEKVLPLDNLDLESPQRSTMPFSQLQRLVALKKIHQQKHNYEHILQQHYENRNIIEEAYDQYRIDEDDLEKLNCYANVQAKKFTMSPDATDNDSNCGGDDSEFSLKYISSDLSLSSDLNAGGAFEHSKLDNCMPTLEDGLSDNESSLYPDINYNSVTTTRAAAALAANKTSTSALHQLESHHHHHQQRKNITTTTNNRQLSSIDYNINNLHISDESISECNLSQNTEPELITNNQNQLLTTSEVVSEKSLLQTSEKSITPVNVGSSPTSNIKREDEEADTDLETDRLLGQQRVNELYGKLENKVTAENSAK